MGARNGLQRDWSSLPPELLNLIAKNLNEIFDFVRFRAVCIAWRLSTQITDLSSQFPWILDACENWYSPDLRFYSIHFNKMHTIHAPKMLERRYKRLSEEYLLVYPCSNTRHVHRKTSLLNPLNNYEILLTSLGSNRPPVWWWHQKNEKGELVICYGFDGFDCNSKYFACRLGNENWRALQIDSDFYNCAHFFLKNMIFCVEDHTRVTKVVDITTGKLIYVIPEVEGHLAGERVHLVEASGDILRVAQQVKQILDFNIIFSFGFHRLVVSGSGSPYWAKIEGISGHALFIDRNGAFTIKANDLAGIRANCVYLLRAIHERNSNRHSCVLERIEIETGAREQFPCPLKNPKGWFIPKLMP